MRLFIYRYIGPAAAALGAALLLGTGTWPEKTGGPDARSSEAALTDTLQLRVTAGSPLIASLPDSTGATYSILRAPALSWLIQRSFLWNTSPETSGRHAILLVRDIGSTPDTLVLLVTVD